MEVNLKKPIKADFNFLKTSAYFLNKEKGAHVFEGYFHSSVDLAGKSAAINAGKVCIALQPEGLSKGYIEYGDIENLKQYIESIGSAKLVNNVVLGLDSATERHFSVEIVLDLSASAHFGRFIGIIKSL